MATEVKMKKRKSKKVVISGSKKENSDNLRVVCQIKADLDLNCGKLTKSLYRRVHQSRAKTSEDERW